MNNIIKAAGLDLALVKPYMKSMGLPLLMSVIFAAANRSIGVGISYAMAFISITESYTFTISEKYGMERLYGILPVSKKQLVLGRYLYTFMVGLVTLIISLIIQSAVLFAMSVSVSPEDIAGAVIGGIVVFSLLTIFQLPGYYAFGYIKGRFFMLIPALCIFLFASFAANTAFGEQLIDLIFGNIFVLILLCAAALVMSVCVSVIIVQNKKNG